MAKGKVKKVSTQVFRLHISLSGTLPIVWRRVLVPGHFTLVALHSIIQHTMGWQMSHLYDFQIGKSRFSEPDEYDTHPIKSVSTSIESALKEIKTFAYNYDFGDSWQHEIKVEEVESPEEVFRYPICIGGENACPPEDCGGFPGYENLKEAVSNKKHPEHVELLSWVGGYFNPEAFDANRVNRDFLWNINWAAKPNDQGLYIPFADF